MVHGIRLAKRISKDVSDWSVSFFQKQSCQVVFTERKMEEVKAELCLKTP